MSLRYVGLMSGTSLDGMDAALVQVAETDEKMGAHLESFLSVPYSDAQRRAIKTGIEGGARDICRLNFQLAEWLADTVIELLHRVEIEPQEVAAIGSHGQTIWHEPPRQMAPGSTLQVGEPAVLAERVGVPVVSDFRARDMAAGGEGAPLVPMIDRLLFRLPDDWRALQNIGGMANVSFVPPEASDRAMLAFDTGPGVAVIDAVVEIVSHGGERYDAEGRRAARGVAHEGLLSELLDDDFFQARPPKSTGRERYGATYAKDLIRRGRQRGLSDDDLIATATALTATTIGDAYRLAGSDVRPAECIVSGGGTRNPTLMQMLAERLDPIPVTDLSALGWDPDAKEAAAFAILAHLFQTGHSGNLPSVTGARGPRILGKLTPP